MKASQERKRIRTRPPRAYITFQRDMVNGDKPVFATAMGTLNTLADYLKKVPA